MIERSVSDRLKKSAEKYPVITLMGPRQSGKTTVARAVFPNHQYINLENLDLREAATEDPRGFLSKLRENVILDEIQKASDLVSYLQQLVDEDDRPGRFILTGSENLTISNTVSQSLAGRTSIFKLLPLTIKELFPKGSNAEIDEVMFRGFYPRIHAKKLDPTEALASYCETYIQKDVRTLLNVRDLSAFTRFLKLCAAHTGQLLDMTSLGNACGLDQKTIRSWLSILEASFIIYLLPPFYRNIKKRLVKSPKLYFFDVGLACYLIGIRDT
ncbi:MAG: ATP-binding protein, partial [Deltaproteobacteria bacterium]|nr:ATP-binding protein [Deltaproteobacteria bacterium]